MTVRFGVALWTEGATWAQTEHVAQVVDELDFEYLLTIDHLLAPHGNPYRPILEGWSVLSAWAMRTKRVRLGLFVGANTLRPPGLTAKLAATLDQLSEGRAVLGLGAGWMQLEHRAYGIDFGASMGERLRRLDESARIIRQLLDGREVTSDTGHYRIDALRLLPQPVQGHLPMMIGGGGEKTLAIVARHADLWSVFGSPEVLKPKVRLLALHCEEMGRDISAIELTVGCNIVIRGSRSEAEAVYATQLAANDIDPSSNLLAPDRVWLGSSSEIVSRIRRYVELGFQTVIVEMPIPYDVETLERIASEVRPELDRAVPTASPVG